MDEHLAAAFQGRAASPDAPKSEPSKGKRKRSRSPDSPKKPSSRDADSRSSSRKTKDSKDSKDSQTSKRGKDSKFAGHSDKRDDASPRRKARTTETRGRNPPNHDKERERPAKGNDNDRSTEASRSSNPTSTRERRPLKVRARSPPKNSSTRSPRDVPPARSSTGRTEPARDSDSRTSDSRAPRKDADHDRDRDRDRRDDRGKGAAAVLTDARSLLDNRLKEAPRGGSSPRTDAGKRSPADGLIRSSSLDGPKKPTPLRNSRDRPNDRPRDATTDSSKPLPRDRDRDRDDRGKGAAAVPTDARRQLDNRLKEAPRGVSPRVTNAGKGSPADVLNRNSSLDGPKKQTPLSNSSDRPDDRPRDATTDSSKPLPSGANIIVIKPRGMRPPPTALPLGRSRSYDDRERSRNNPRDGMRPSRDPSPRDSPRNGMRPPRDPPARDSPRDGMRPPRDPPARDSPRDTGRGRRGDPVVLKKSSRSSEPEASKPRASSQASISKRKPANAEPSRAKTSPSKPRQSSREKSSMGDRDAKAKAKSPPVIDRKPSSHGDGEAKSTAKVSTTQDSSRSASAKVSGSSGEKSSSSENATAKDDAKVLPAKENKPRREKGNNGEGSATKDGTLSGGKGTASEDTSVKARVSRWGKGSAESTTAKDNKTGDGRIGDSNTANPKGRKSRWEASSSDESIPASNRKVKTPPVENKRASGGETERTKVAKPKLSPTKDQKASKLSLSKGVIEKGSDIPKKRPRADGESPAVARSSKRSHATSTPTTESKRSNTQISEKAAAKSASSTGATGKIQGGAGLKTIVVAAAASSKQETAQQGATIAKLLKENTAASLEKAYAALKGMGSSPRRTKLMHTAAKACLVFECTDASEQSIYDLAYEMLAFASQAEVTFAERVKLLRLLIDNKRKATFIKFFGKINSVVVADITKDEHKDELKEIVAKALEMLAGDADTTSKSVKGFFKFVFDSSLPVTEDDLARVADTLKQNPTKYYVALVCVLNIGVTQGITLKDAFLAEVLTATILAEDYAEAANLAAEFMCYHQPAMEALEDPNVLLTFLTKTKDQDLVFWNAHIDSVLHVYQYVCDHHANLAKPTLDRLTNNLLETCKSYNSAGRILVVMENGAKVDAGFEFPAEIYTTLLKLCHAKAERKINTPATGEAGRQLLQVWGMIKKCGIDASIMSKYAVATLAKDGLCKEALEVCSWMEENNLIPPTTDLEALAQGLGGLEEWDPLLVVLNKLAGLGDDAGNVAVQANLWALLAKKMVKSEEFKEFFESAGKMFKCGVAADLKFWKNTIDGMNLANGTEATGADEKEQHRAVVLLHRLFDAAKESDVDVPYQAYQRCISCLEVRAKACLQMVPDINAHIKEVTSQLYQDLLENEDALGAIKQDADAQFAGLQRSYSKKKKKSGPGLHELTHMQPHISML